MINILRGLCVFVKVCDDFYLLIEVVCMWPMLLPVFGWDFREFARLACRASLYLGIPQVDLFACDGVFYNIIEIMRRATGCNAAPCSTGFCRSSINLCAGFHCKAGKCRYLLLSSKLFLNCFFNAFSGDFSSFPDSFAFSKGFRFL